MDPEQVRDVGSIQIAIQHANAEAHRCQRERKIHGDRRFADAAFAAQHRDDVPPVSQPVAAAKDSSTAA